MIAEAAAVLLWVAASYRMWVTMRSQHALWRISFTISTVSVAVAVTLQLSRAQLDATMHIPNIAGLLVHLVFAVGLAWVHVYLETLRHEHPDPGRVRRNLVVGAAVAAMMMATWVLSPIHAGEYASLAEAPGHPALVVYHLAFYGYMIISLGSIARFCAHEARPHRPAALTRRLSLALIGVACATAVPVMVLYALSAVLPAAMGHSGQVYGRLGDVLVPWPLMVLSLGILALWTMPWFVDVAAAERRWRTLRPLWAHLVARHPEVHLSLPSPARSLGRQQLRERRVIIEINDALRHETVQARPGSGPNALGAALARQTPGSTQARDVLDPTVDETGALEQLLRLAQAYSAAR
jgi:hypothetical protein